MKNKISYKLISFILLISLLVTSISIYVQINNQYENNINKFEKSLEDIKTNQIPILSQSLWNVDYIVIDIFLKNLIQNEQIIYAKIIEVDGKTFSEGIIKELNVIKKEFEITKEVNSKTNKIGKLIIIADLEPLYNDLKSNAINIIFAEIIKMLLISLLIIFAMKRLLTNPLEEMAVYAKQLSLKNLDKPLKLQHIEDNKFNELDIVSESINTMRVNLIKQIKESEEKNNILAQQSKLAAMGEMIGNIAHQWRQPLSLITTTSSTIQLYYEYGKIDEKNIDEFTTKIIDSAKYLSHTIDDFRDFYKPNKEKELFFLLKSFEKTFSLMSSQFKNNIHVIKNINNIEIYGYENELIQVLINILNNAKDELVKKEKQKLLIFIDAYEEDDTVYIKIKDNAGGIPEDIINRIFEPYFTTKHKAQGTGIGLYMSEEIITKHMNGKIDVQNVKFIYEDIDYIGAEFKIVINKKSE